MDGDDLPDTEYESIYGAEAMWARTRQRLERAERMHQQTQAQLTALLARMDARRLPWTGMQGRRES